MRRQVFPHPPSPTTTNFLENLGGTVMSVAVENLLVEVPVVWLVLTVPLLIRVLWVRSGFRCDAAFVDTEPNFSLNTEPRRRR